MRPVLFLCWVLLRCSRLAAARGVGAGASEAISRTASVKIGDIGGIKAGGEFSSGGAGGLSNVRHHFNWGAFI